MEKVTGIGGLFFRSQDPESLARWYYERLGVWVTPTSYDDLPWQQQAGPTAFAPFPLDRVLRRCQSCVDGELSCEQSRGHGRAATRRGRRGDDRSGDLPNGRFARLCDPEGNPIELWEPSGSREPRAD